MEKQDYVPLVARMKEDKNAYVFGPFRLEPANHVLWRGDHSIHLSGRELELLYVLVRPPSSKPLTRDELEEELFQGIPVDASVISRLVNKLRSDLGKRDDGEDYIETVPSEGYRLSVRVREVPPPPKSEELQAVNLYEKGLLYLHNYSREGFTVAIESFEQLLAKNPQHVEAHLGRFEAYTWSTIFNYHALPPEVTLGRARESARAALDLAPSSAAAQAACGFSSMCYERNWAQAWKELQDAVKSGPGLAAAHLGLSLWHVTRGEDVAALNEIELAHKINQLSPLINVTKGFVFFFARRYVESLRQFEGTIRSTTIGHRVKAFDAAYYGQALVEAISGSFAAAHEAAEQAYASSFNVLDTVAKAYILALEKKPHEAEVELAQLLRGSEASYVSPYHLATIAVALGNNKQALEWLEKARHERDPWVMVVRADPRFIGLHTDPRFNRLLLSLGLPPL